MSTPYCLHLFTPRHGVMGAYGELAKKRAAAVIGSCTHGVWVSPQQRTPLVAMQQRMPRSQGGRIM